MFASLLQLRNAYAPSRDKEFGSFTDVRLPQPLNNPSSILVSSESISIFDSFSHFAKAYAPMFVVGFGIVIPCKLLHPRNADPPIFVTEFGIVTG